MTVDPTPAIDTYMAAWNSADPGERRALLATAVTDDCEYAGPDGRAVGPVELDAAIAQARDYVPGARVERDGEVAVAGGGWTFGWVVIGPAGGALMTGADVVSTAPDGRLRRIEVAPGPG